MKYSLSEKIEIPFEKKAFKSINVTFEIESKRELEFFISLFNKSSNEMVKTVNEEVVKMEIKKFTKSPFENMYNTWDVLAKKVYGIK